MIAAAVLAIALGRSLLDDQYEHALHQGRQIGLTTAMTPSAVVVLVDGVKTVPGSPSEPLHRVEAEDGLPGPSVRVAVTRQVIARLDRN